VLILPASSPRAGKDDDGRGMQQRNLSNGAALTETETASATVPR